jgi:hypothetical protein
VNSLRPSAIIFLVGFFIFSVQDVIAHGGSHDSKEGAAPPAMDSMYSAKENKTSDNSLDTMFSPGDLFLAGEVVSPDPMPEGGMEMTGSHDEHAGHQKSQVELARHKLISSSRKGFGAAVGITLFAGIVFAGLTFLRRGE